MQWKDKCSGLSSYKCLFANSLDFCFSSAENSHKSNSGFKVPGFDVNPVDEMGRTPTEASLLYGTFRFKLKSIRTKFN